MDTQPTQDGTQEFSEGIDTQGQALDSEVIQEVNQAEVQPVEAEEPKKRGSKKKEKEIKPVEVVGSPVLYRMLTKVKFSGKYFYPDEEYELDEETVKFFKLKGFIQ